MVFEKKLRPFQPVLVRDDPKNPWVCDFFSYYNEYPNISRRYVCMGGRRWRYCIQYQKNKKYLGVSGFLPNNEFTFGQHVMVRNNDSDEWEKAVFVKRGEIPEINDYPYVVILESDRHMHRFRMCKLGWGDES